ncbi:MAG: hypothetical protein V1906_01395 [Candidatus Woesearchaeota archaeon]
MAERLSTFLKIFGDTPRLRVLDFFMVHEEFDYSMTDIAKESGVGYSTLKMLWPALEKNGIVIMTREVGKAKLYRINGSNNTVKDFKQLYWRMTKARTRRLLTEKIIARN